MAAPSTNPVPKQLDVARTREMIYNWLPLSRGETAVERLAFVARVALKVSFEPYGRIFRSRSRGRCLVSNGTDPGCGNFPLYKSCFQNRTTRISASLRT